MRTALQFLGPQIADILSALNNHHSRMQLKYHFFSLITQFSSLATNNSLIDSETGNIHHGGNFQAMEKKRHALHHIERLLFAQFTELSNTTVNRGLPPSLAATDPLTELSRQGN